MSTDDELRQLRATVGRVRTLINEWERYLGGPTAAVNDTPWEVVQEFRAAVHASERKTRDEVIAEFDALPPEEHVKRIEQARRDIGARIQARRDRAEAAAKRLRESGA